MSKRNRNKRVRAVRRLVSQTPPGYIDLVQWLKSRGHAQSSGEARKMIADGRVQSESHPLGREEIESWNGMGIPGRGRQVLYGDPRVPARLRDTIVVRRARKA